MHFPINPNTVCPYKTDTFLLQSQARQQLDQATQKNKQLLDELNVARNMGESDASRRAADVAELARLRREASHSHKAFETQSMKWASALREQLRHDETLARLRHENQEELGWLRKAVEASRVAGETAEHARVDAACQLDAATRDNGVLREETRLQTLRGMEASDQVSSAKVHVARFPNPASLFSHTRLTHSFIYLRRTRNGRY